MIFLNLHADSVKTTQSADFEVPAAKSPSRPGPLAGKYDSIVGEIRCPLEDRKDERPTKWTDATDLVLYIFGMLDHQDLMKCRLVSRRWMWLASLQITINLENQVNSLPNIRLRPRVLRH